MATQEVEKCGKPPNTGKDLGVLFTSDLKSGDQCAAVYMKANKMLGPIKRTLVNKLRTLFF